MAVTLRHIPLVAPVSQRANPVPNNSQCKNYNKSTKTT